MFTDGSLCKSGKEILMEKVAFITNIAIFQQLFLERNHPVLNKVYYSDRKVGMSSKLISEEKKFNLNWSRECSYFMVTYL